jgi:hypothetical protein
MRSAITRTLSVLIALHLGAAGVAADPISPFRRTVITACLTVPCIPTTTDGDPSTVKGTLTAGDGSTLKYDAFAVSRFGSLGTSVSATLARQTLGNGWVLSSAQMTDVLTAKHPLFSGTGFFEFTYTLDGAISDSGIVNAEAEVQALVDRDGIGFGAPSQVARRPHLTSASGVYSAGVFAFDWNVPYNLVFVLNAAVGNVTFGGTPTSSLGPVIGIGSGHADLANTAVIGAFSFFDASMRPLSDVQLISESGTEYEVSQVPEPATIWLVVVAGALGAVHRRVVRRRTQR